MALRPQSFGVTTSGASADPQGDADKARLNAAAAAKKQQADLDQRARSMQQLAQQDAMAAMNPTVNSSRPGGNGGAPATMAGTSMGQAPAFGLPSPGSLMGGMPAGFGMSAMGATSQMQGGGGTPSASVGGAVGPQAGGGGSLNSELYKPLTNLQGEAGQYRQDLKNGTGRIAGQIAGATGDWLAGMQNNASQSAAQRGVAGGGVSEQMQGQARDTATRAGAKQLGDLAAQREAMLGGAIQGALPITQAAPNLALAEKGLAVNAQQQQNQANQQNFSNQLALSNQAFNQYMGLMNAQRSSPFYSGFSI